MKKLLFGFLVLLALAAPADARPMKIVSMVLGEGLQHSDSTGLYPESAEEILQSWGGAYMYAIRPFRRALRDFNAGAADCIWALDTALLDDIGLDTSNLIQSAALLVSSQRIFTRPGEPLVSGLAGLEGLRVGVLIGSNLEAELAPIDTKVIELNTQEAKLGLLALGRVDAIIGWMPDLAITAHLNRMPLPDFDLSFRVRTSGVAFVCHDTAAGRKFVMEIDPLVEAYRGSESYQGLMKKFLGKEIAAFGS